MNIEVIGVSFFRSEIAKTDYLVANIKDNDREPSWDGDVEVYCKPADNHKKQDLILKVPVQVKGMKMDDISKLSLSYPVEIADMRNYLEVSGTIFIVVCFDSTGENKKIFYARLLPYELRPILAQYGTQRTRKVKMEPFPTNKVDIENLFLNIARDIKKQRASLVCPAMSLQDLEDITEVIEFTVGYTVGKRYGEVPFDYLFDNGAYIYAKILGGFEIPIERMDRLESASRIIHSPVCVNGKVFYDTYKMVYKKDAVEINIGKSIKYTIERQYDGLAKLMFTLNGTLSERICDAEFIVEAVKNRRFTVGAVVRSLESVTQMEIAELNVPKLEKYLKWLRTVKQVMETLHVKKELELANFSKEDEQKIKLLKSAIIDGLAVPLKKYEKISFGKFTVANLKILVVAVLQDEKEQYALYDFNNIPSAVNGKSDDGEFFQSSQYILLKKDDFLACCNIDYDMMVAHIKSVPITIYFVDQVFTLFFELLKAYDEMPQKEILIGAIEIAEWFKEKDLFTPKPIWSMNYYQAVKRLRPLENQERQEILSIIENEVAEEEIYVGAYILLGDRDAARRHFERMDGEWQAAFQQYPIWQLWEK